MPTALIRYTCVRTPGSGAIRCILWPNDYEIFGRFVQPDAIVVARGSIDRRGGTDEANLIVNELIPLDQLESRYTTGAVIRVDEESADDETLAKVREIVRGYPGSCELHLMLQLQDGSRVFLKSHRIQVELTAELRQRLDDLLGPGRLQLITSRPSGGNGKRSRRGSDKSGSSFCTDP